MKIKQWIKDHKAGLINAGIVIGTSAVTGLVFFLGVKFGENNLIETLIHQCENGDNNHPCYTSSDKNLGNLMYEIHAECIGD